MSAFGTTPISSTFAGAAAAQDRMSRAESKREREKSESARRSEDTFAGKVAATETENAVQEAAAEKDRDQRGDQQQQQQHPDGQADSTHGHAHPHDSVQDAVESGSLGAAPADGSPVLPLAVALPYGRPVSVATTPAGPPRPPAMTPAGPLQRVSASSIAHPQSSGQVADPPPAIEPPESTAESDGSDPAASHVAEDAGKPGEASAPSPAEPDADHAAAAATEPEDALPQPPDPIDDDGLPGGLLDVTG